MADIAKEDYTIVTFIAHQLIFLYEREREWKTGNEFNKLTCPP